MLKAGGSITLKERTASGRCAAVRNVDEVHRVVDECGNVPGVHREVLTFGGRVG